MREVLFRGKQIDNGDWIEGYYLKADWNGKEISAIIPQNTVLYSGNTIDSIIEIDPKTLCQYTGMNDKKGKRIWENDIVRIENSMDEGIGNIEFYGGMWYVDGEPSNSMYDIMEYDDIAEIEVIGNIFDNPDFGRRSVSGQK